MGTPFARAVATTVALLVLFAIAMTRPALADNWIDAATGQRVPSGPIVGQAEVAGSRPQPAGGPGFRQYDPAIRPSGDYVRVAVLPATGDPNRAFDPASGRNFFFDQSDCQWKDAATGQRVPSGPIVGQVEVAGSQPQPAGGPGFRQYDPAIRPSGDYVRVAVLPETGDPDRAFDPASGRNFVRVSSDCSPKRTTAAPPTTGQKTNPPQTGLRTAQPLPQTCGDARDRAQAIAMGCIADPNAPAQLYTAQPQLPAVGDAVPRDEPPPCTGPYCYRERAPDAGQRDVPGYTAPPYGNPYGGYPNGYGAYPNGYGGYPDAYRGYPYGAPYSYPGAEIPGPR